MWRLGFVVFVVFVSLGGGGVFVMLDHSNGWVIMTPPSSPNSILAAGGGAD